MQLEINIFVEERQILKIQKELMPKCSNRDVLLKVFLKDESAHGISPDYPLLSEATCSIVVLIFKD